MVLRNGGDAAVLLCVGSEGLMYNNLRCDLNEVQNKDALFETYWESAKDSGVDRLVSGCMCA